MPWISTPLARMPPLDDKGSKPKSAVAESSTFKKDAAERKLEKLATSSLKEVEEENVEQDIEGNSPSKEYDATSKDVEG